LYYKREKENSKRARTLTGLPSFSPGVNFIREAALTASSSSP